MLGNRACNRRRVSAVYTLRSRVAGLAWARGERLMIQSPTFVLVVVMPHTSHASIQILFKSSGSLLL